MNEQIRSILAQETTKTSKIRQLYLLGVPRAEIARMVTNGNYGFVVNALRRMSECECGPNIQPLAAAPDYTFNRKFGIEIEAYNCSRERLARELRESGMAASRRDNYYCRGLGHVSDGMIRSARTVDELKGRIGDRYHKVNLEAYSRHKTVEFRQHSGTTSFTKMRNWVLFLHKLVTFATREQVPAATALQDIPFLDSEQKLHYNLRTKKLSA